MITACSNAAKLCACGAVFGLSMKVQTRDEFEYNKEPQRVFDRASWTLVSRRVQCM